MWFQELRGCFDFSDVALAKYRQFRVWCRYCEHNMGYVRKGPDMEVIPVYQIYKENLEFKEDRQFRQYNNISSLVD